MTKKDWLKYKHECLAKACRNDDLYYKVRNKLQTVYGYYLLQQEAKGDELIEITESLVRVKRQIEEMLENES